MHMDVRCRVPRPRRCAQPSQIARRTGHGAGTWHVSRCNANAPRGTAAGQPGKDRHEL
jgi:hypothetical protein